MSGFRQNNVAPKIVAPTFAQQAPCFRKSLSLRKMWYIYAKDNIGSEQGVRSAKVAAAIFGRLPGGPPIQRPFKRPFKLPLDAPLYAPIKRPFKLQFKRPYCDELRTIHVRKSSVIHRKSSVIRRKSTVNRP